jgi:hypothetical protein
MRLRSTISLSLCLVTLVSACGGDATQPIGAPSSISFSYSGYRTGDYSASGFVPDVRTGTRWTMPWASAGNFATIDSAYTRISASLPASTGNHLVELLLPRAVAGTFPLSAVHFDEVIFDYKTGVSNGQIYSFTPGTITVTSSTAERVVGTFSGTAVDTLNKRTITVTNGKFDVHIDQP